MKKIILAISVTFLISCASKINTQKAIEQNNHFKQYKENFVLSLWKLYPNWASSVGYHLYDSILVIQNNAQREKELAFSKSNLDSLRNFNLDSLSDNNKTDYYLIENQLKGTEWGIKTFQSFVWNPANYNVCEGFAEMINNNYDSLNNRLRNLYVRMENVSAYYIAAKENIKNPTLEHTALAIDQNLGGISVFETDLPLALSNSTLSETEKQNILERSKIAIEAINGYVDFLKSIKNEKPTSFRIGKELFEQKFAFDIQSSFTAEGIYEKAVNTKAELHNKMFAISQELWPKYFKGTEMPTDTLLVVKQMIDALSIKHVKPEEFQSSIEKQIPMLVKFVKEKDLLFIDPSKPLIVRKEPAYMAGVAGASISAPGPYDKNGNTYYNVGSMVGWEKERSESYLREYNEYILQILNIHEAIPGHYTQLVYANQSPSIIKAILGNGAMIEGWAVYTERMMLENGYGNNEPEMWLMYYKWNLRSACNTILDYSLHVKNITKEDAIYMLVNEAFQQQAEAEGKWKRATLSQVQLCSYFTGYSEIYALREELKEKQGKQFNLKAFHEEFLGFGNAPVKYIAELMRK